MGRTTVLSAVAAASVGLLAGSAQGQLADNRAIGCDSQGRLHSVEGTLIRQTVVYRCWDGTQWSEEEVIGTGYYPHDVALTIDDQDNVHVAWCDGAGTPDNAEIFYAVLTNEGWSEPENTTQAPEWDCAPSLAALPNGEVHMAWQHTQGLFESGAGGTGFRITHRNPSLWHRVRRNGEWSAASPIVERSPLPTFGHLSTDTDGWLHVVYTTGNIPPQARICHAVYAGGGWPAPEEVSSVFGILNNPDCPVMMASDGRGGFHVVYKPLGKPVPAYCYWGDEGWSEPALLCDSRGPSHALAICAGRDGSVHLAYAATQAGPKASLLYQLFSDGKWGDVEIPVEEAPFEVALAADRDGTAHLVWGAHGKFNHAYRQDGEWKVGTTE